MNIIKETKIYGIILEEFQINLKISILIKINFIQKTLEHSM